MPSSVVHGAVGDGRVRKAILSLLLGVSASAYLPLRFVGG